MIKAEVEKKYYYEMVQDVKSKLSYLSRASFIKAAFKKKSILEKVNDSIGNKSFDDLKWGTWPPLFLFVNRHTLDELKVFEDDLTLVVNRSGLEAAKFLEASIDKDNDRAWSGGIFETFIKASLLRKFKDVKLDFELENGKNVDLRVIHKGDQYSLECTVLTDSDEDRLVWDKFMEDKKKDESAVLTRPGKYDSKESKSPSLYYDCLRFYAKVYDKIAPKFNLESSQLPKDTKNILLISIDATRSTLRNSPGIGWALDELFADQPRGSFSPKGITNVSLQAWVEFTAKRLIEEKELCEDTYINKYTKIVQAPKLIGGIMLFNGCALVNATVNYNAHKSCKLSHEEISLLENILNNPPIWKDK